jgi:hypothetical protein
MKMEMQRANPLLLIFIYGLFLLLGSCAVGIYGHFAPSDVDGLAIEEFL